MAGAQTRTGVGTLMGRACIGYFQRRCLLPHSSPQPHNAPPSLMYFKKHYESMCNPWWQLDSPRRAAYADMQFVKAFQGGKHETRCIVTRRMSTSGSSGSAEAAKSGEELAKSASNGVKGPTEKPRAVRGGPVSWASLALLVVTGIGLILYWDWEKKRQLQVIRSDGAAVARTGPGVGKAAIGGPFKLVNQDGKEVTDKDFVGKWTLIYFGFTYCPDVCPDELTKLAEAVDEIEKKVGEQIVPVFISIDPERDTVEQIREYLKEFHPRLVGLTGSVKDIQEVAREYRVYYMKTEDEGNDYLVDHSIIMYLMDPNMDFVKFFGKNYDAKALAEGVSEEIRNANKQKEVSLSQHA
ncbi:hypothetical protein CY35_09G074500 [Sphagnum magellanicum]|nr:hypothetical protein CY35_09G074500 [Sphagnum magellanicum]KAH9552584.1 hypothetical protein CY35_09G074500 [Sphagnum magellanicum]